MNTITANSPSFNALYVPSSKRVAAKAGKRFSDGIDRAKPVLEAYAENFDIHILPYKFNSEDRGLAIKAEKPTKSIIKHLLTKLNMKYQILNKHMNLPSNNFVRLIQSSRGLININSSVDIADLLEIHAEELTYKIAKL